MNGLALLSWIICITGAVLLVLIIVGVILLVTGVVGSKKSGKTAEKRLGGTFYERTYL